jgi:hypothetical protein
LLGVMFALKLYSAPFALFFLVKRHWKAAGALVGVVAGFVILSVAMFGWSANRYYVESVLPNVFSGMLIDPYNVGQGSMTAFLRRSFVPEPELNPHPLFAWPAAFTFLQTAFSFGILALVLQTRRDLKKREFAWLVIALLLLAPINATYVFTLMLLPVALLMPECSMAGRVAMLAGLAILGAPLPRDILAFFPRVWVLAAFFVWAGRPYFRRPLVSGALAGCIALVAVSRAAAFEPFERLLQPGYSIAVMSPAISSRGLIYHGFGDGRYVLHSAARDYAFEGHAFHPAASPTGGPIVFELVSKGHSQLLALDPESGEARPIVGAELDPHDPAVSPDGRRVAFVSRGSLWIHDDSGSRNLGIAGSDPSFAADASKLLFARDGQIFVLHIDSANVDAVARGLSHPVLSPDGASLAFVGSGQIWLQHFPDGKPVQLTSATCNHDSPVWESDSHHLIFTSDCGRGLGLPGLYRAEVTERRRLRSQQ